ncbi:MAG: lysozyme inhibitor LprI family protein [Clostridium sp.]|uniref:lysozyme inhibitor LprI family protein n=1 Tax=Clostridium sp. TaxID=1506 RepID=UPI003F307740
MNKKIIGIIVGIIIVVVIACSVGFVIIHKQNEALQQAKLQQQKLEQQMKADQAKAEEKEKAEEAAAKKKEEAKEKAAKEASEKAKENASSNAQTTQTDRNQMNSLNDTKAQFLNEMSTLKPTNPFPGGHLGQATQQELLYHTWDGELNKIWGVLQNMLPKSEMASLTADEKAWIQTKAQYQEGYNNGDAQATRALAQMTKERCYYLVNNYM